MISDQYAAGFFDGEGCINVSSLRGKPFVRILVVNTNIDILEKLQQTWGGDIQKNYKPKSHWKQAYTWRLQHSACLEFLQDIYPYLVVKKNQAEAAFMFFNVKPGRGHKWTEESLNEANKVIQIIKNFNKKGIEI